MNVQNLGSTRPKLYPPKALLSMGPMERPRIKSGAGCSPHLSGIELRRIVTEVLG